MKKKIKCPKCGNNMKRIEHIIFTESEEGKNSTVYPSTEIYVKYACINPKCPNYDKELDKDELEE